MSAALSQDFQEFFEDYGPPEQSAPFSADELSAIEAAFPKDLMDFFKIYGRATLHGGKIHTCHPGDLKGVLALVFGADDVFVVSEWRAFAYSAFGKIKLWNNEFGLAAVDLLNGTVVSRGLTKTIPRGEGFERSFMAGLMSDDDLVDQQGKKLLARCIDRYGKLHIGECYGFVPAIGLGGSLTLENLKRLKAPEHFTILAQIIEFNLVDVAAIDRIAYIRTIG